MVFIVHKIYFCLALNFGLFLFIMYTLPRLLTNFELRSLFLIDLSELLIFITFLSRQRPTLPCLKTKYHWRSWAWLRVRNGIGYNTNAIITGNKLYNHLILIVNYEIIPIYLTIIFFR